MDLIYLDYNCFQRRFDDIQQTRIKLEAFACQDIFIKAESHEIKIIWSFMHQDETLLCPFPQRQYAVLKLAKLCQIKIAPEDEIYQLAKTFQQQTKLTAKDAIHVACADYIKANYFLTCDDNLIKQAQKLSLNLNILNPIDYIK